jgi:hypothetical protein
VTAGLALTVIGYALAVGVACLVPAVRGTPRSALVVPALAVVELGVTAQALLDVVALWHGPRPIELATHVGYLLASLVLVPVAAGSVRLDDSRWGSAALALGCLLVAVVTVRLHQTARA